MRKSRSKEYKNCEDIETSMVQSKKIAFLNAMCTLTSDSSESAIDYFNATVCHGIDDISIGKIKDF